MAAKNPELFETFKNEFPDVFKAYEALASACHQSGTLDARERRLVKLALAIGAGAEGAVHSNVRRALDEGLSREEVLQVALLAITSIGFPRAMAALSWIKDILET